MAACPHALDPLITLDQRALRQPEKVYRAALADGGPVQWVPALEAFLVLGLDEITEVMTTPDVYSSRQARGRLGMETEHLVRAEAVRSPDMQDLRAFGYGDDPEFRSPNVSDPPRHTRLRKLIAPSFGPGRIRTFVDVIEQTVDQALTRVSEMAAVGAVDLVAEFTQPVPLRVLAAVLGVPNDCLSDYARWSVALLKPFGRLALDPDELDEMVRSRKEFDRFFVQLIQERAANPRDDFMTDFVTNARQGDEPLSIDEMLAAIESFVIAGHETTTKTLSSALLLLMEQPELVDRVRKDQDALDSFVDEVLRLESPGQMVFRHALIDCELAGVKIPAGAAVALGLGAGNRDERSWPDADAVVFDRANRRAHVTFGAGIHYCVGHALAKHELRIALRELVERFDIALPTGTTRDDLEYVSSMGVHGLVALRTVVVSRAGTDRA